jgi:hypothetical protein
LGTIHRCAACGQIIGGANGMDNVFVVRHVRLTNGSTGWIALHVRCVNGPWLSAAMQKRPPGRPLELPGPELTQAERG